VTVPVNSEAAGSAAMQGELWSARAADWADQEELQAPIYDAILDDVGVAVGTRVLDIACGSGVALRAAVARGATAAGIDAAPGLVEIARRRAPEAEVHVCAMEQLPFADDAFDVATGFNAFQFADDIVAALREACRVTRPGGSVAIQVWGRPEHTESAALVRAFAPHLPFPLPSGPGGRSLCDPGVLEELALAAGLQPRVARDISCPFDYPDADTLVRTSLGAGLALLAARIAGEDVIRQGILDAMAPFRNADGGYHTENEWHYLLATA
jgi:SAM-dependent methyltransferase